MKMPKQVKQMEKFLILCDELYDGMDYDNGKLLYDFLYSKNVKYLCNWFEIELDMHIYCDKYVEEWVDIPMGKFDCIYELKVSHLEGCLPEIERLKKYLKQWKEDCGDCGDEPTFTERFEKIFK